MSQLGVILQESRNRERETITILGLLSEQMEGLDESLRRRKTLKERLGFGMGCCVGYWASGPTSMSVIDDGEDEEHPHQQSQQQEHIQVVYTISEGVSDPDCVAPAQIQTSSGMNLAAALEAERQFRPASNQPEAALIRSINDSNVSLSQTDDDSTVGITRLETPLRVSLMRLLQLTTDRENKGEVVGTEKETEEVGVVAGSDSVCCVCMVRKKGAAFIPCGHTFCRVCTRELWLTRGSCPLCNRSILELLDIF